MVFYTQLSDLRQHFDEDVGGRLGIVDRPVVLGKLHVVLLRQDVQAMLFEVHVYRAGKFKRIDDTVRIRTETDLLICSLDESHIETCLMGYEYRHTCPLFEYGDHFIDRRLPNE